ncbi:unnamed protein product [Dovyalis caffra]|uniref:CCT domain-containing protein n=1 Tax=Dovyalis caffra TaxID=77055 RepID=A0AAV1RDF4_9ROSI|nr:unnamed protein product [Dovyalis caffra]
MYGSNTFLANNSLSDNSVVINSTSPLADQLTIPDPLAGAGAGAGMELGPAGSYCTSSNSASGCCSSYGSPSSLANGSCSIIQRSISTHSFQKNGYHCYFTSHPHDFLDMDTSPVRRVFSTGDLLQGHRAESPLSSESSLIIESMSRACKYSPEEKKERIERKILADSRPRIRGRFARNDEIEKNPQLQWSNISGEEDEEDDDNWTHFLDTFLANSIP